MGNELVTIDAETLMATPFEKTMFIVEGLIPQGVGILCGSSKIGKSWLMLWLGLQVAQGNPVWDSPTLACDVLYLCLEDTYNRIQNRLYYLTEEAPENLRFAVISEQLGGGLEERKHAVTEHDIRLCCGIVKFVTVYSKDDILFTMKDGTEIRV